MNNLSLILKKMEVNFFICENFKEVKEQFENILEEK
jgi:hypothetical protein